MTARKPARSEPDAKAKPRGSPGLVEGPPPPMANALSSKQRDFMLLYIFVLAQHGYIERASVLAESMFVLGDGSAQVVLARAVLDFFLQNFAATLAHLEELDRIDPIERFGAYTFSHAQRMRRYLKARCFHKLRQPARARDVVDSYLRHGGEGAGSDREEPSPGQRPQRGALTFRG